MIFSGLERVKKRTPEDSGGKDGDVLKEELFAEPQKGNP